MAIAAATSLIALILISMILLIHNYAVVREWIRKSRTLEGEKYEPAKAARGVDGALMEWYEG